MKLNKKGIELNSFIEMVSDDATVLNGIPQPRNSGDFKILCEWFFGKDIKPDIDGAGLFGDINYIDDDSLFSTSSTEVRMRKSLLNGESIGHVVINLSHEELKEDNNFNKKALELIQERGVKRNKINMHNYLSAGYFARGFLFRSVFGKVIGSGGISYHSFSSSYYIYNIKRAKIIKDWVELIRDYNSLRKRKKRNKGSQGMFTSWSKYDDVLLEDSYNKLFTPSKEFLKEFNRARNLERIDCL